MKFRLKSYNEVRFIAYVFNRVVDESISILGFGESMIDIVLHIIKMLLFLCGIIVLLNNGNRLDCAGNRTSLAWVLIFSSCFLTGVEMSFNTDEPWGYLFSSAAQFQDYEKAVYGGLFFCAVLVFAFMLLAKDFLKLARLL
ncbi:hypothetical protein [Aeromonas jandaei]|uniref:hypothetical protein n=1 Tax=Aeromonas jandaei TaxID=650 RepID=UPI003BA21E7D